MPHEDLHEQLPSGKVIIRHFAEDGSLVRRATLMPCWRLEFSTTSNWVKVSENILFQTSNGQSPILRKAHVDYSDMPPADNAIEDLGSLLLQGMREEQRPKQRRSGSASGRICRIPLSPT